METSEIPKFVIKDEELFFKIRSTSGESIFDRKLKEKWTKAEQKNLFRYSVRDQPSKVLEGEFGFYAQLNKERMVMRRKPEEIISLSQPFDQSRFNFTQLPDNELLFDIGDGKGNDVIAINVSPIILNHCLLLPNRFKCLPQQATLQSIHKAFVVLLFSNSENMRVVFNSLGANASVNHLHWHVYYLECRMPLEWIHLKHLIDMVYVLEDFPSKAFCIKFSSFCESTKNSTSLDQSSRNCTSYDEIVKNFTSYVYKVVACLQRNEIPYNIYITRAKTDVNKKELDDIRIYIWARTPSYGVKESDDAFIIAACEVFGHLTIRTEEAYATLDEAYVCECLRKATTDAFLNAQRELVGELKIDVLNRTFGESFFCNPKGRAVAPDT